MLILHGERTPRPVTQGLSSTASRPAGVPAPTPPHALTSTTDPEGLNSKHWYGEVLAWLGKYLK
jgi:hypothetical protein